MRHGCQSNHRARIALAVLATGSAAICLLTPAASSAATTAPTLILTVSRSDVRVAWKFTSDASRGNIELEIQRGPDAGHFGDWLTVRRPRETAWRLDRHPLSGTNVYRARVVVNGVDDAWGETASISTSTGSPGGGGSGPCANARWQILALVNQARAASGAAALDENAQLDSAAQTHTRTMADAHNLTHDGWITEIRNAGYTGGMLGQNVAVGYTSASSVMDAWTRSDGHRSNILNPHFHDIGIGCVADGGPWWTQDFGG